MISSSRDEKSLRAKQEGATNDGTFSKATSSSRQWSALRNPRIVRVSRTFGGKDRHSKVCTVRGLRDRRIRLSVPTAIQLYDLQDRLGLNQPSKVIDWLLDATKNDIEMLPPLQMPQAFGQFCSPMVFSHDSSVPLQSVAPFFDADSEILRDGRFHSLGIKIGSALGTDENDNIMARSNLWEMESSLRLKSKQAERMAGKEKWVRTTQEGNDDEIVSYGSQIPAQKLYPLSNCHSSLPAGLLSSNSFYHLDGSTLSIAQLGTQGFLSHPENSVQSASQLIFIPQPSTLASSFPSYPSFVTATTNSDPRDNSHFQSVHSDNVNCAMGHYRKNNEDHYGQRDAEDC